SCVHCGRPVALVGGISLSVLTLLATHLQRRHPGEKLGAHPGEDAIVPLHNHARRPGLRAAERGLTLRREARSAADGCSLLILPRSSLQSVERLTLAARDARATAYFGTRIRSGTLQSCPESTLLPTSAPAAAAPRDS